MLKYRFLALRWLLGGAKHVCHSDREVGRMGREDDDAVLRAISAMEQGHRGRLNSSVDYETYLANLRKVGRRIPSEERLRLDEHIPSPVEDKSTR